MQEKKSPIHAEALRLAAAGTKIFPCAVNGKRPRTEHGFEDRTTDPDIINRWWSEADYNLGIVPEDQGRCVLDPDGPEGESTLFELELEHGQTPDTLVVHTPRGGRHLYFEGSLPGSVARLGPKLDTRGHGSYVLVPPSRLPEGEYRYGERHPIAACPAWVIALLSIDEKRVVTRESAVELDLPINLARAREWIGQRAPAIEGQGGDNHTLQTVLWLRDLGLSIGSALGMVSQYWNERCVPPWPKEDLQRIAENAYKYAENDAGAWALDKSDEEQFAEYLATMPEAAPKKRSKYRPYTEAEQDAMPEPAWLIPNLIPEDSIVMLFAPPSAYKSFLALDIALHMAAGRPGYGLERPAPSDVLYIGAESPRGISRRRRPAWRKHYGIEDSLPFYLIDSMPYASADDAINEMMGELQDMKIRPKLIVIDTLARFMAGMNENDAKDAGVIIQKLENLKRAVGCSILVIHHTGKAGAGPRGSSALLAGFDAAIEIERPGRAAAIEVKNQRQKDAEDGGKSLFFRGVQSFGSLVFEPIDASAYRVLIGDAEVTSQTNIMAALRKLGAMDAEHATTAEVLAADLAALHGGSTRDILTTLRRSSLLSAYHEKHRWWIPG